VLVYHKTNVHEKGNAKSSSNEGALETEI